MGRNELRKPLWQWSALLPSYSCTLGFSVDELFTPEVEKLINFPSLHVVFYLLRCLTSLFYTQYGRRHCSHFNFLYKAPLSSPDSGTHSPFLQHNLPLASAAAPHVDTHGKLLAFFPGLSAMLGSRLPPGHTSETSPLLWLNSTTSSSPHSHLDENHVVQTRWWQLSQGRVKSL